MTDAELRASAELVVEIHELLVSKHESHGDMHTNLLCIFDKVSELLHRLGAATGDAL